MLIGRAEEASRKPQRGPLAGRTPGPRPTGRLSGAQRGRKSVIYYPAEVMAASERIMNCSSRPLLSLAKVVVVAAAGV